VTADIYVSSEWGELKECVYGSTHEFVLPQWNEDADLRPVGAFRRLWRENGGRDLRDADAAYFAIWKAQIEGVVTFLEASGVKVHRGRPISEANRKFPDGGVWGSASGFHRDGFVTIGNNVIELAPRTMFHRLQKFATRHILADTMDRGARYFAQPDSGADPSVDAPGWGYLEGGAIFVLGKDVLVGHSGHCSNPEGARWLQHMLGDEYRVHVVDIVPEDFQHLDCVLCTPREGLMIACLDALPTGLPRFMKDWETIEISKRAAVETLAANHLVLNDQTILIPAETEHDPMERELARRGLEVVRLPYGHVYRCGGSFRCAHQPLIRV